jgi:hypothetical protein
MLSISKPIEIRVPSLETLFINGRLHSISELYLRGARYNLFFQ